MAELLSDELEELKAKTRRQQEEFNAQRAKMKDLFLQKEAELEKIWKEKQELSGKVEELQRELDDARSQLLVDNMTLESNFEVEKRRANEEIASLQQIVQETVQESSSTRSLYDVELKKLQVYIQKLHGEITDLKTNSPQQPDNMLAPGFVFNALTKGLVKKLGAETLTGGDESTKEDAEMLRSLVEPLNDQIKALKEKLRATDEQLQKCVQCGHQPEFEAATATNSFETQTCNSCDMCSNYEAQLVSEQKHTKSLQEKIQSAVKAAERHKEDLLKEIGFRKEIEEKWNEKKEEHKQQVAKLTQCVECTEQDLKELKQFFKQTCKEMGEQIAKLGQDRDKVQSELTKLQKENDHLAGKYTLHSQQLESQQIDLPSSIEELHEMILQQIHELILTKIGKEQAESNTRSLQDQFILIQEELKEERHNNQSLSMEITILKQQIQNEQHSSHKLKDLQSKIESLTARNIQLEASNNELKTRNHSLQQGLDTTETVQKDFVKLSQSLQVQLEKIRDSNTQVRWQFEEDVTECPSCKEPFVSHHKKKLHCRHCGQIFCGNCLTRTVASGPNARLSQVCDVCHTLLNKSSAPYFSEAPPTT